MLIVIISIILEPRLIALKCLLKSTPNYFPRKPFNCDAVVKFDAKRLVILNK